MAGDISYLSGYTDSPYLTVYVNILAKVFTQYDNSGVSDMKFVSAFRDVFQ